MLESSDGGESWPHRSRAALFPGGERLKLESQLLLWQSYLFLGTEL